MTLVTVNSGAVQVTGNGINQTVDSGQAAQLTGSNPVQLNWVTLPAPDSFDQWSDQRDQKVSSLSGAPVRKPRSSRLLRSGWLRFLVHGCRVRANLVSVKRGCGMDSLSLRPLGLGRALGLDLAG